MSIHGGDVYRNHVDIDFSINVNPFGTPECVKEALHKAVEMCGKYPDIEKGFPKLWLTSTAVLDRIVNASVVNQSTFEWSQIQEEIETYVVNDSLNKATHILKENGYVIISGIPGIGKTTLARFLVYSTLGNDNEYELCICLILRMG